MSPLLLAALGLLAAGTADPHPLSLEDALREARSRHPALAAARADAEAAARHAEASRGEAWPRVISEAGARASDHPVVVFGDKLTAGQFVQDDFQLSSLNDPDPIDHYLAAVGVEWPLDVTGRLEAGSEGAEARAAAARARARDEDRLMDLRVVAAYHGVHVARGALDVAQAALNDARGHEAAAAARVEAGGALRSDLLRAQVTRLARENDLTRRESEVELALARLRRLVGLPPGAGLELTTPLEPPAEGTDPMPLDAWLDSVDERPDLEALRQEADAAGLSAEATRDSRGPDLKGFARYELNAGELPGGQGSWLAGVWLQWAVFDRSRGAAISGAALRESAGRWRLQDARDEALLEIRQAHSDVLVAGRGWRLSREATGAALAARGITAERYAAGMQPITDLLDVEESLVAARMQELGSLHAWVVARARLARAAGKDVAP